MLTYLQAISANIWHDKPENPRERLVIWLVALNESLPPGKRLSDTEIQMLSKEILR